MTVGATMLVSELIAKLQEMPQDMEVYAAPVSDESEWPIDGVEIKAIGELTFDAEIRHYVIANPCDVVMLS